MKRQLKTIACDSLRVTLIALTEIKAEDVKNRKKAKPSQKAKWTKQITHVTNLISYVKVCKTGAKRISGRV